MAGFDPRLADLSNQALAMRNRVDWRVPVPGAPLVPLADGGDPLAEQDAALAAAAAQDAAMSGVGPAALLGAPDGYTPDPGMSPPPPLPPPVQALDPNAVSSGVGVPEDTLMSTPADMSYPGEPMSAPAANTQPLRYLPPRARRAASGEANPIPGMLRATTGEKNAAKVSAEGHEGSGDYANAQVGQAQQDIADVRDGTYGSVADVQDRLAGDLKPYEAQLGDLQDSHNKAVAGVQAEQAKRSKFMGEYVPKDRRSMAQKVTGALAVAFSGLADQVNLAAGLNAGMNIQTNRMDSMMSLIQRGIDRDLEQQQAMLNNAKTAHAALGTELGQLNEKFGTDVNTLQLAKAMKLGQAAQEIEALKTRGLSAEQQPMADEAIGRLNLERENLLMGIDRQRYEKLRGDEQQLKLMRAKQMQGPKPVSQKDILEMQGKALDNEKKRRDLEQGPETKLNDGQQKLRRDLLGAKDDIRAIAKALDSGVPYIGTRGLGSIVPDAATPEDNLMLRSAIDSGNDLSLRDKSGASIGREERAGELDGLGVYSSDPEVAKNGLGKLYRRIIERGRSVGLTPEDLGVIDPDARDLTRPLE